MRPRFVGRLGLADAVTATNAAVGFLAVAVLLAPTGDVDLAARLVLLAAIADGLDGIVARRRGSTPAGEYVDALADVASFGVAPAALVVVAARDAVPGDGVVATAVLLGPPALYVAAAVVRLALYTAYDAENDHTVGVQTTLAATVLAAAALAGAPPVALLAGTVGFTYLMVASVDYPDLLERDAFVMGLLQALAVLVPGVADRLFPTLLLAFALAYLLLAPRFYWRNVEAVGDDPACEDAAGGTGE